MQRIVNELEKTVFGQRQNILLMLTAFLAGGHVLLEGVPGLGKTKMVRTLARLMDGDYRRIQFTPDMMPSDIVGNVVYNMKEGQFQTIKGPVFTNLLLADEINRTPPKTQAALLEAMEERQVTIQGSTFRLPDPFFVAATQNPVEYEGTYPLPEAQLDRFMFKLIVGYPPPEQEKAVLTNHVPYYEEMERKVEPVLSLERIREKREEMDRVVVEDGIVDYVLAIVQRTRDTKRVLLGASPRAGIFILLAAKAWAVLDGRGYVTPDDVKVVALPALRHRLITAPQFELEGGTSEQVVKEILGSIPVPR
ncbi:MAG: MoxR family ATPase [Firmicutes bacterium]|nr:MoxR family ATPase [Bacillota bacterium]